MGSTAKQALGLMLFLAGWTVIAAGFAQDGSIMLIALGAVLLAASVAVLLKVKGLEESEG